MDVIEKILNGMQSILALCMLFFLFYHEDSQILQYVRVANLILLAGSITASAIIRYRKKHEPED